MTTMPPMTRQEILDEIVREHGLEPLDIYLLPLVPLIEVIWADKRVQQQEVDLLVDFARQWLARLRADAGGDTLITAQRAHAFIHRFIDQPPPPALLERLRQLSLQLLAQNSDQAQAEFWQRTVLEYCIDIAAATVPSYPYALRERVVPKEKELLLEIMGAMHIAPDNLLDRRHHPAGS